MNSILNPVLAPAGKPMRETPIPCHLIAGPLGVGKTTAIRKYVARASGFTAVLVNDFGETAYDASYVAEAGGEDKLRVENIAGGCVCCTSAAKLLPALRQLTADPRVQRILIEPSGVAMLDPLLNLLRQAAPECGVELAPVIVLVDPVAMSTTALGLIAYWRNLVDRARIAVINRCDLASPRAVAEMQQALKAWTPKKLAVVQTRHGELPDSLFGLREAPADLEHAVVHHVILPVAGSFRSGALFCREALIRMLNEHATVLERFKGVFRTESGYIRVEVARGMVFQSEASDQGPSSADWIGCGEEIAAHLNSCLIS